MIKTVYLAASFAAQEDMKHIAQKYMDVGLVVTSNWIYWHPDHTTFTKENLDTTIAILDIHAIQASDAVVVDYSVPTTKGGFHVELGIAIGAKKWLFIVGNPHERPNAFYSAAEHYLDHVQVRKAILHQNGLFS